MHVSKQAGSCQEFRRVSYKGASRSLHVILRFAQDDMFLNRFEGNDTWGEGYLKTDNPLHCLASMSGTPGVIPGMRVASTVAVEAAAEAGTL